MYSELKDHKGEYVAIDNGKVKGYTGNLRRCFREIWKYRRRIHRINN
ncbi:MAG: hypothetical protein AMDU5_GPLC00003G0245 [Thermoplasmatales archaeon Gpl]|nr:MAG: hypothetical protein AMDU5_GPLC00003G0245 [Thermoplasmatales archaeon Gpl]